LRRFEGVAHLRFQQPGATLRRVAMTIAAAGAFVAGVMAVGAVLEGQTDPGVLAEGPGGRVLAASPTGFAWAAGIRAGQLVLRSAPAEAGWSLQTEDGAATYSVEAAPSEQALRDSAPLALASLGFAILTLLLRRTRRDWVVASGSLAIAFASIPLAIQGNPQVSTLAMAASLGLPAGWLAARGHGGTVRHVLSAGIVLAFVAWWAVARQAGWDDYIRLESVRGLVAVAATVAVLLVSAFRPSLDSWPVNLTRPAFLDLAVLAALAVFSVSLLAADMISPIVLGVGLVAVLVVVPVVRRRYAGSVEQAILGDLREHARAEGADEERARIAREMHDDHLQELVGVIRRLEIKPGTEAERNDLRELAARMRELASELRPPVLDDFGLPGALEYLAEHSGSPTCPVTVSVTNTTRLDREQRPPADVELALYRVVSEAVSNAIRHANARRVDIGGEIGARAVLLEVMDDGIGVTHEALRAASRRNRMGVGSMKRRAAAIDADFSIRSRGPGTSVRVAWHR
jgi:signal transduction histidine kinase